MRRRTPEDNSLVAEILAIAAGYLSRCDLRAGSLRDFFVSVRCKVCTFPNDLQRRVFAVAARVTITPVKNVLRRIWRTTASLRLGGNHRALHILRMTGPVLNEAAFTRNKLL